MPRPERYIHSSADTVATTILCGSYIYRQQVGPAPKKRVTFLGYEGSERRGIFYERRRDRESGYIHQCCIEVRRYRVLRVSRTTKSTYDI